MEFDLTTIDWTAISTLVTFMMMIATLITVLQNKKQVKQIKEQWEEENKPKIYPRVTIFNQAYFLEFYNAGKEDAFDIDISINEDFINNLSEKPKELIRNWIHHPFFIKGGHSVYAFMGWCKEIDKEWTGRSITLEIDGIYNGQYQISFTKPISQFIIHTMMVRTPSEFALEKIAEGIGHPDHLYSHATMQESLENISNIISNIESLIKDGTKQDK